jgi:hypothetical protein
LINDAHWKVQIATHAGEFQAIAPDSLRTPRPQQEGNVAAGSSQPRAVIAASASGTQN